MLEVFGISMAILATIVLISIALGPLLTGMMTREQHDIRN
jgi:hypothetical protein